MEAAYILAPADLQRFNQLHRQAIEVVSSRFYATYAAEYARFGERGREICRESIGLHLDHLRPVLEFGSLRSFTEYLRWLAEVLASQNIPTTHIRESLQWLGGFYWVAMPGSGGQTIAQVLSALLTPEVQTREDDLSKNEATAGKWDGQEAFEAALVQGDRQRATEAATQLTHSGHSLLEIEVHFIQSALYNIGHRWQNNEVSIAQEHLATATAQTVMATLFSQLKLPRLNGKKVILACIEGNEHSIGLRMVSDAFELNGWDVQFLGANTPTRALVEQIRTGKPNLVGLSIAIPDQLRTARDAISMIRSDLGEQCPCVIVGGYAINRFPPLVKFVGADAHASDGIAALLHAK